MSDNDKRKELLDSTLSDLVFQNEVTKVKIVLEFEDGQALEGTATKNSTEVGIERRFV